MERMEDTRVDTQKEVADARNFVTWFAANPCSRSTPHIYISALPLCAKSSWVYQHYLRRTQGLASIAISQRDEAVLAIWTAESPVWSMAISPDGDRIAAGSDNGSIHVYDIHTGAIISGPFNGHTSTVLSVAFSPDGTHIVSCSSDKTVIIWDSHSGNIVAGPLHRHKSDVWSVAFSPDGSRVVSGSDDESVIVWDIHSGHIILGPLKEHTGEINSVAFSPDSQLIASGSSDHTIILWDAYTGTAKAKPFRGHTHGVTGVAFSPDRRHLASCSYDKTIRVWDIQTGTIIGQPFEGHKGRIWSIAFSADGSYIISGGDRDDQTIVVWETHTGSVVLGPLHGHTRGITSVGFLPDGSRVVSCSPDSTIRIWDIQSKDGHTSQPNALEVLVCPIAFSPDCTHFISNTSNGALRLWDTHTGSPISRPFVGQAQLESIHSVACSSQASYVAAAADDSTIRMWNMLAGIMISQHNKHKNAVRCLVFSPDGTHVCSGSDDCTIIVWDIENDTMVGQPYEGHTGSVRSIAYSPDGTHIASGGTDQTVRVWELSSGTLLHTLSEHEDSVLSVAFSPDGRYIAAGGADGRVWMWNTQDSSNPVSGSYSGPVNSVCFSPDGTRVIAGSGSAVYILDTQTMEIISKLALSCKEEARWVGYSPDGSDILSVSTSNREGAEELTDSGESPEEPAQQPLQNPNIIRVWRSGPRPDQTASSSTPCDWLYEPDGRILSPEGLVMWVPPDLVPYLKPEYYHKSYYNPLVISPHGIIDIGYKGLCIGDRWTECYIHKD
ncbi:POC1 centriolar protein A [Ceratobasidium sp. 423]|nr:POC1 centriolar protein A [Ceratobasidium sp. 423]